MPGDYLQTGPVTAGFPLPDDDKMRRWMEYFLARGFSQEEAMRNATHLIAGGNHAAKNLEGPIHNASLTLEQSGGPAPPRLQEEVYRNPNSYARKNAEHLVAVGKHGLVAGMQAAGDSMERSGKDLAARDAKLAAEDKAQREKTPAHLQSKALNDMWKALEKQKGPPPELELDQEGGPDEDALMQDYQRLAKLAAALEKKNTPKGK